MAILNFFLCPRRNNARSPHHTNTLLRSHTLNIAPPRIITPPARQQAGYPHLLHTVVHTHTTPRVTTHTRILPGRCQTPLEFRFQAHSGDAQQVISFPVFYSWRAGIPQLSLPHLSKHTLPSLPPIPLLISQAHCLSA